ncbi:MAG: electron transport complex subunit E [Clostridia bacterium]
METTIKEKDEALPVTPPKENNLTKTFLDGIIYNNPVLIQLLGMCPTLATSTSLENAIGMGLAATFVLIFSNFVISLLRKIIPSKIRIAAYVVIIAGFVTIVDMLLAAFVPALSASLGLYIPLIVVNCIILARAESFASKNKPIPSIIDGLGMGLGFTLALIVISFVRELLGNGTLFGFSVFGANFQPALIMLLPPGGFLTLGLIVAAVKFVTTKKAKKGGQN